jgi:hypothetical protein
MSFTIRFHDADGNALVDLPGVSIIGKCPKCGGDIARHECNSPGCRPFQWCTSCETVTIPDSLAHR